MNFVASGGTVRIFFNTTDADGAPVAPSAAFTSSDIAIHKNGSAAEKTTTNGITVTSPFDSKVGLHLIEINVGNETGDVGFWENFATYQVRLETSKTVDSISVDGLIIPDGSFTINNTFGGSGSIHFAYVKQFYVNELGGVVDPNSASLGDMLSVASEPRVIEDADIPNSSGNPRIQDYLSLEAASGFSLKYMDQNIIITG